MASHASPALHQSFLPAGGRARAFVWKYSELNKGRRPRHFHSEPELNLIAAGHATFGVGGSRIQVFAGQLIGFPPGQDHVLLDVSPDVFLYSIGLDPTLASEVVTSTQSVPALPLRSEIPEPEFKLLTRLCADIVERDDVDALGAELWQRAHWLQTNSTVVGSRVHVLTRRALAELARRPDVSRERLAHSLRASPSDVSRYFHRDMGLTLVQYRTRARLLRLIRLIDAGNKNLKEVAQVVGFGSYSQCHRAFCAELGWAPREFFSSGAREQMQQAYALR